MNREVASWQFLGFSITSLGGTILHFLYEWTNESVFAAPFSGVNESTWEHMKLLFFPLFIFAVAEYAFFRDYPDFWCIKLKGTLKGLILIPVLFYTYNGAFGKSPDFVNISIFFISAAVVFIRETILFKRPRSGCRHSAAAFIALCFLGALFVIFTFVPPELPLFMDPTTGEYGFSG